MGVNVFYSDYYEARAEAERLADSSSLNLRLRRVREYGRVGYVVNFIPNPDRCFGRDLEGELIEPSGSREAKQ